MNPRGRRRAPAAALVLGLAAALALLLVACGGETAAAPEPSPRAVSLQLNWFHEAEFVGYYVAEAKGFYKQAGLSVDIREGGPGDPAIDSLLDDSVDFAVSSFAEAREATVRREPVTAVMAAFQIPPLVIFALADSGISKPEDLAGKRVGVTTDYWDDVLTQTLQAAGVRSSRVTRVKVRPEQLTGLYGGKVDAWLGYAQDEPIKAEMAGHPVTMIFPADYGVGGYEGLVLARKPELRADPELAQRFVQASREGWQYAVEHPDEAARILLEWAPDPGLDFQRAAVRAVGPLVDTPQAPIGWIEEERWKMLMDGDYDAGNPGYTVRFVTTGR